MDMKRFIVPCLVAIVILTVFNWRNERAIKAVISRLDQLEVHVQDLDKKYSDTPNYSKEVKEAADCIDYLRNSCSHFSQALHKATGKWHYESTK